MVEDRADKSRLKCPICGAFIAEVIPRLDYGQKVVTHCPKCRREVTIEKERKTA